MRRLVHISYHVIVVLMSAALAPRAVPGCTDGLVRDSGEIKSWEPRRNV